MQTASHGRRAVYKEYPCAPDFLITVCRPITWFCSPELFCSASSFLNGQIRPGKHSEAPRPTLYSFPLPPVLIAYSLAFHGSQVDQTFVGGTSTNVRLFPKYDVPTQLMVCMQVYSQHPSPTLFKSGLCSRMVSRNCYSPMPQPSR
jgi:hypothetical protein